jgi:hypothetical protein
VVPCTATTSCTVSATASSGSPDSDGIPPASETTSGLLATENRARISDAVIPRVRFAYRST